MKVLILAGNTLRAKSYTQALANSNLNDVEIIGLLYGPFVPPSSIPKLNLETKDYFTKNKIFIPNYEESLEDTFKKNEWDYSMIENRDVNSEAVLNEISSLDCDLVVFAGYGGQLLKQNHFSSSRKYLHMHPGKLPIERGSTTIYYSILNKRKCTVTAFI
jgi:methionyl-tRNA formyltransferase